MINSFSSGLRESFSYLILITLLVLSAGFFFPVPEKNLCLLQVPSQAILLSLTTSRYFVFVLNSVTLILLFRLSLTLIVSHSIVIKSNMFPIFLMMVHIGFTISDFFQYHPEFPATLFLFNTYYFIVRTYRKNFIRKELFYAGFSYLMSVYFDPVFILFFPFLWILLLTYRVPDTGEIISLLSGLGFCFLIAETGLHLFGYELFHTFLSVKEWFQLMGVPVITTGEMVFFSIIFFILNFSVLYSGSSRIGLSVFMDKHRQMMIYWILFGSLPFFTRCSHWTYLFFPVVVPYSYLTGETLYYMSNKKIRFIIFWMLVLTYVGYFVFIRLL